MVYLLDLKAVSVVADAGFEVRLLIGFDQEVGDLFGAEGFGNLVGLPADEGADGRNLATVPNDAPEVSARRFGSPMVLGFVVGADAGDLYRAVCEGVRRKLEGNAAVGSGDFKGSELGVFHGVYQDAPHERY